MHKGIAFSKDLMNSSHFFTSKTNYNIFCSPKTKQDKLVDIILKTFQTRTHLLHLHSKINLKTIAKVLINNFIRAKEVRVIDEEGKQLGVMNIFEAIDLAKSKGLDLIQVTEKVDPPICKIANYGKYLYTQQKKDRKIRKNTKETKLKEVQLGFNISPHDIEIRAKRAEKFLKDGDKVKVNLPLRGREKAMGDFAKKKMEVFIETMKVIMEIKVEREIKREPRGFSMIISKK